MYCVSIRVLMYTWRGRGGRQSSMYVLREHACIDACMHAYVYVPTCIQDIHGFMHVEMHACVCFGVNMYMRMCMQMYVCNYIDTFSYV